MKSLIGKNVIMQLAVIKSLNLFVVLNETVARAFLTAILLFYEGETLLTLIFIKKKKKTLRIILLIINGLTQTV